MFFSLVCLCACVSTFLFLFLQRETKKPTTPGIPMFTSNPIYFEQQNSHKNRKCYWHYTTATDTQNVKRVFEDIHTMIVMQNLENISPS